jgi:mRNA deadenylase 3'-5' endonuclease subunit Ccr4
LTNYGKSLKKRKNSFCLTTECKVTKVSSSTCDTETLNTKVVEYNSSCCTSCVGTSFDNDLKQFKFTLSSYNLLAPALAQENNYLYKNVPNDYLDWYYRRAKIYNEVKYFDSDVKKKEGPFVF